MRKFLLFVGLLALVIATASPALAQSLPPGQAKVQAAKAFKARAFQGVVDSVNTGESFLVVDSDKYGEDVKVVVDDSTKIQVPGNKIATLVDFKAGDRVVVQSQKAANDGATAEEDGEQIVVKARRIHLIPAQIFTHFTGVITGRDEGGNTITVRRADQESRTFKHTGDTVVRDGSLLQRLSAYGEGNLEVDMTVTVVARVDGDDYSAVAIVIHGNNPGGGPLGTQEDYDDDVDDDQAGDQEEDDEDDDNDDEVGSGRGLGRANAPGQLKKAGSN